MHPELFSIGDFTVHTYGFMIMVGALLGFWYAARSFKRDFGVSPDQTQSLALLIILAAFVGGKLFFYFEDPGFYFSSVKNLTKNMGRGFVFYGSLIFAIPTMIWYMRKIKIPVWPGLDHMAITACIVHGMGRMGCFFAGCCYGVPTENFFGVTFTHEHSRAPLNEPLHPTQLYSGGMLFLILLFLWKFRRYKKFDGQLFLLYVTIYAIGRGVIEIYRGDEARGYIIDGVLSHSQFISIFMIIGVLVVYFRLKKKGKLTEVN